MSRKFWDLLKIDAQYKKKLYFCTLENLPTPAAKVGELQRGHTSPRFFFLHFPEKNSENLCVFSLKSCEKLCVLPVLKT